VKDGDNGFWANTQEKWVDRLSLLIEDSTLRNKMGQKGILTVERDYSLTVNAEKFLNALKNVFSS
jgi:glycosyltransferase involved in cell wall biosynthesis